MAFSLVLVLSMQEIGEEFCLMQPLTYLETT